MTDPAALVEELKRLDKARTNCIVASVRFGDNSPQYQRAHDELNAALSESHLPQIISLLEAAERDRKALTKQDADSIIKAVLLDVAELPDRTSPEDQPEMMLVSGDELALILVEQLSPHIAASSEE